MNRIFWRLLLIVGLAVTGLFLGGFVGGMFLVPKSAGLAGGVMVLWYALGGAAVFAIAGGIAAFRLANPALRKGALIAAAFALAACLALTAFIVMKNRANREPDSAFAAAGQFVAVMERLDTSDPYLFVKMKIDAQTRTWTQTGPAPDHAVLQASMRSKTLIEIRQALNAVAALRDADFAQCRAAGGPPVRKLTWVFSDSPSGSGVLELNKACIHALFPVARALSLIETVTHRTGGKVGRK